MENKNISNRDEVQESKKKGSFWLTILGEENMVGNNYYKSTPIITNYYYHRDE